MSTSSASPSGSDLRVKVPMKFKSMQNGATTTSGVLSANSSSDNASARNNNVVNIDSSNLRNSADRQMNSSRSLHSEDSQGESNIEQSPYSKFQENAMARYKYKISTYYESSQNNTTSMANVSSKPGILTGNDHNVSIEEFKQANEKVTMEKYHQRQIKIFESFRDNRRMPMIPEQEVWLANRESERMKKNEEYMKSMATTTKNKGDKEKGDKTKTKGDAEKTSKSKTASETLSKTKNSVASRTGTPQIGTTRDLNSTVGASDPPKPYSSASEFMSQQFPMFVVYQEQEKQQKEAANGRHSFKSANSSNWESNLHKTQHNECVEILDTFQKRRISAPKADVLMKALVVPQDLPEQICIEQIATMSFNDKLMMNPLPPEFLRTNKKLKDGAKKVKSKKKK